MSEAFLIAAIGVGGAMIGALITALLQPLVAQWLSPKRTLVANVRANSYGLPSYIEKSIDAYLANYLLKVRPTDETRSRFWQLERCEGLIIVDLQNRSRKLLTGIVISLQNHTSMISDVLVDGTNKSTQFGNICEVGDLRPNGKATIRIWSSSDHADSRWFEVSESLSISAHEYDKIRVRIETPPYISRKNILISKKLIWRSYWVLLLAWLLLSMGPFIFGLLIGE